MQTHKVTSHPGIYWYLNAAGKRRYAVSTPVNGKQKWAQGFATVAEAEDAKARMRGSGAPASMTVQTFLEERWLPTVTGAPQTLRTYHLFVNHIVKHMGKLKLAKLEPWDMESFKSALAKSSIGDRTAHEVFACLRLALRQAVRWKLISYNPAGLDYVDAPIFRKRTPPLVQLTTDELVEKLRVLLAVTDKDWLRLLIELTVLTGMREKEILGLEWAHVDMGNATLAIPRMNTKTDAGERKVAIDTETIERLRQYRLEQMRDTGVQRWVFVNKLGKPWSQQSLFDHWDKARKAADLADLHFHDLRHIQGALLARLKINPKVAQERLGHADISTTLGIYSHVNVEDQREAADAVAALFRESLG